MGLDIFQNFNPGKFLDRKLAFLEISRIFRYFFKNLVFTLKTITEKNLSFQVPFLTSVVLDVAFKLAPIVSLKVLFW